MKSTSKYFSHTSEFYRFLILKKINEMGSLDLPIISNDSTLMDALTKIHLNNLIQDGLLIQKEKKLSISPKGINCLNKHYIDYQIDLLNLSKNLDDFYSEKISRLVQSVKLPAALYGASDTLKSFFPFLNQVGLEFVCVIDDDVQKQTSKYLGLPVIDLSEIKKYNLKTIVISSIQFQKKIKKRILSTYPDQYIIETIFK